MSGYLVSSTSRIVINVHDNAVIGGVIGGVVVLLGVVVTELLVRARERRKRLEQATWELQSATHGGLLIGHVGHMSGSELAERYAGFVQQLGRIRAEARWPIRHAKEIVDEVDAITLRFTVAVGKMGTQQAGPPRLGPILGDRLVGLVFKRGIAKQRSIEEALRAEGLPTLAEITGDEAINAPLNAN